MPGLGRRRGRRGGRRRHRLHRRLGRDRGRARSPGHVASLARRLLRGPQRRARSGAGRVDPLPRRRRTPSARESRAVAGQLREARETAFRILLHPFAGATPFFEYRLWRADPEIRFRGVIHEQVVDDIHRVAARDGRPVSDWGELELDHLGYEGDQAAKHRRNLPLLRRQLDADPNNIFNWNHLARVLIAAGDPAGAEQALEEAVALARVEGSPSSHSSLAWGDLVRLRHDRGADVTSLLAEGKARWPENWLLVWIEGNILLDAGRLAEARRASSACSPSTLPAFPSRASPTTAASSGRSPTPRWALLSSAWGATRRRPRPTPRPAAWSPTAPSTPPNRPSPRPAREPRRDPQEWGRDLCGEPSRDADRQPPDPLPYVRRMGELAFDRLSPFSKVLPPLVVDRDDGARLDKPA